jgi:hypothetical protein
MESSSNPDLPPAALYAAHWTQGPVLSPEQYYDSRAIQLQLLGMQQQQQQQHPRHNTAPAWQQQQHQQQQNHTSIPPAWTAGALDLAESALAASPLPPTLQGPFPWTPTHINPTAFGHGIHARTGPLVQQHYPFAMPRVRRPYMCPPPPTLTAFHPQTIAPYTAPLRAVTIPSPAHAAATGGGFPADGAAFSPVSTRYPQTPETPFSAVSFDGVPMSRDSSYLTVATMPDVVPAARRDSVTPSSHYAAAAGAGYSLGQLPDTLEAAGDSSSFDNVVNWSLDEAVCGALAGTLAGTTAGTAAATTTTPSDHLVEPAPPADLVAAAPPAKRSRHTRLLCPHCAESPDGFRGEHELRRHMDSKHTVAPKRWVCRDPRRAGIHVVALPTKDLEDCKNCFEGKQYKRYDNAIAHLRRVHFAPPRGDAKRRRRGPGL